MKFFTACVPPTTTAQQKRVNHKTGHFFKSKAGLAAVATFHEVLAPHKPEKPLTGPVSLTVEVTWPWRKSEPKRNLGRERIWKWTRPDLSNWIKQLEDELARWRFIEDDAQVAELIVRKYWGDCPGIQIELTEIGDYL